MASGTDHPDVVREVKALGLYHYFAEIAGAPLKRAVQRMGFAEAY